MKQVKITGLQEPSPESVYTDRLLYKINLGNGIVRSYTTKKQAQAFLTEVSRFLTYKLHECNELYISVFTMYRRAWFYFDHNKPKARPIGDLREKERLCEYHLHQIAETFTTLYRRSSWANGNHFVFVHFATILTGLADIMKVLNFVYSNKSTAGVLYEIEILQTKITYCRRTIENYTLEIENEFKDSQKTELAQLRVV